MKFFKKENEKNERLNEKADVVMFEQQKKRRLAWKRAT